MLATKAAKAAKSARVADKCYKIYLRLIWSYEDGRELLGTMPVAQQMGKAAHLRALVADGVQASWITDGHVSAHLRA